MSLASGTVTSDASASYDMTLAFDGGSATGGTMDFAANASLQLEEAISTDPGDYATTHADANTFTFMDFDVTDEDVLFSVNGSLLDETLGFDGNLDVLFSLADITSGFSFVLFETDGAGDQTPTTFIRHALLEVGRTYRLGVQAQVEKMCAETPESVALCPGDVDPALIFGPDDFGVTQSAGANIDFTFTPVPEPARDWLLAAGVAALAILRRSAR
jgi:hypothetical protein